jgi:hypothetical protein
MHSFTDCAFGVILGAAIWALQHLYLEPVAQAITDSSWIGKLSDCVFSEVVTQHNDHHDPI